MQGLAATRRRCQEIILIPQKDFFGRRQRNMVLGKKRLVTSRAFCVTNQFTVQIRYGYLHSRIMPFTAAERTYPSLIKPNSVPVSH